MLVSISRRLAYLAMPKTGTQSLERVLTPLCDIRYGGLPRVKHMTLQTFERFVRPYLEALGAGDTETLCVIREPVDWLGSWYRYRGRAALDGLPNSTKHMSFAEFVEAYLRRPTPPFARVGRISRFVAGASGGPGVTHMFRYENLAGVTRFLSDRFETRIVLPRVNVSSRAPLELPAALRARLETELSEDFALYADHAR
jgi:Sulfotransferase family